MLNCTCGNPECKNEIEIDTVGGTMLCLKEVTLSDVKTREPIMFYMNETFAIEMIRKMQEYLENLMKEVKE